MDTQATVSLLDAGAVSDSVLASYVPWLSPSEAERHRRFLLPERRRRFLMGRVLLRMALGTLLDVPAHAIVLDELVGQAPKLRKPERAQPPGYSISHSGDWVACVTSAHTALGLSIEVLDPAHDIAPRAEQIFDAIELAALGMEPEPQRRAAIYRKWGEKEASFKLGVCATPSCIEVPHARLSIIVCSALALTAMPTIEVVTLD